MCARTLIALLAQFSFFWMTLGFGLMIMLDGRNNIPMQVFFPLIAALGLGPGFRKRFQ